MSIFILVFVQYLYILKDRFVKIFLQKKINPKVDFLFCHYLITRPTAPVNSAHTPGKNWKMITAAQTAKITIRKMKLPFEEVSRQVATTRASGAYTIIELMIFTIAPSAGIMST